MNRVLAFDPQNLNLAVLGGITIDAINRYLADQGKGFFLPLDPPFPTGPRSAGFMPPIPADPLRLRYGAVRDQVLGVRGADAMGREIGFGGKTVKNVSGYDLTKFFIGSAGSLGLITSISFRVYPLPEAASLCDLIFDTVEGLEKFLAALRKSVWVPSAVTVTEISAVPGGPGARMGRATACLIGFEGHRPGRGAAEPGPSEAGTGIRGKGGRPPGARGNGSHPSLRGESGMGFRGTSHLEDFRPLIPGGRRPGRAPEIFQGNEGGGQNGSLPRQWRFS